jgi:glycosyltransferase involved in cell wall biosynthesis
LVVVYDADRPDSSLPAADSFSSAEGRPETGAGGGHVRKVAASTSRPVRIINGGCGKTLGELRNMALDSAAGDVACQWDDDDQSHPERLARQWEAMRQAKADACFLASQFHYFTRSRELFVRDTGKRGIECTVMHRTDLPVRYPALERAEDTAFMVGLKRFRCAVLPGVPWLYLRLFHGENTWDEEHHRQMMRHTWDVVFLGARKEELAARLESYDIERPVTVCGHDGPAFRV